MRQLIGEFMRASRARALRYARGVGGLLLLFIISPLLLAALLFVLLILVVGALYGLLLQTAIWWSWCRHGRDVLLVVSDSPVWRDYVTERILPTLGDRAVVLNWSERARWRRNLAVRAFRYFGGHREFNPIAIVFRPLRNPRCFRFYRPFLDFRHGNTAAVTAMESDLYRTLGLEAPR